jgi:flagellar basal-body rod protein FlgG
MNPISNAAVSGIYVQQNQMQNIASNLANSQSIGFQESSSISSDVPFYNYLKTPGSQVDNDTPRPVGVYAGSGAAVAGTLRNLSQGETQVTNNPMHFLIDGGGYIAVNYKDQKVFTRNGQLQMNKDRKLQTIGGYDLDDDITVPDNVGINTLGITEDGIIYGQDLTGARVDIGQINVYNFNNEQGLQLIGDGFLQQTDAAGDPIENIPGQNGAGIIKHKMLEKSNVDTYGAMLSMLDSQRITQHLWHIITSAHKNETSAMESAYSAASA